MEAARHDQHPFIADGADDKLAGMAGYGGFGKAGDIIKGDLARIKQHVLIAAKAAAQHHRHIGRPAGAAHRVRRRLQLLHRRCHLLLLHLAQE